MSVTKPNHELPDAHDREVAVGNFGRNLVVTAGAGTGKTTLLVNRLVHLLLRNPDPLKITEIVALTFTNKAADEMKLRLRQRLQAFLDIELDGQPKNDTEEKTQNDIKTLIDHYQLSKDELDRRITTRSETWSGATSAPSTVSPRTCFVSILWKPESIRSFARMTAGSSTACSTSSGISGLTGN